MYKYRRVIVSVIALVLALTILLGLIISALAASSSQIQDEIDDLEAQADEIAEKQARLKEEIEANNNETLSIVEQRAQVDQEAELIRQEVDNMNQQLQQYNLLIAEKQAEVDGLLQRQSELLDRYKQRIRAMQEQGDISYWAVIFRANSFSDMLNRVAMVEEIAKSDQRMMDELRSMASEVLDAKNALADEKAAIEQKKVELAAAEEALAAKREESESLLDELIANAQLLAEEDEKYESLQNELADEIAKKEQEYNQKVEEERKAYEAAQKGNGGNVGTNENGDPFIVAPKNESFIFPLPTNIGSCITSPYGMRYHPVTGVYKFHNGVDYAANAGRPIYASKSGIVTTATCTTAWGNYVVINHGDGFSTLYAHMTHYIVSYGEYVEQGQTIGYVGSTGYSTGPHLHFTIFYNGSTVNPSDYVSP